MRIYAKRFCILLSCKLFTNVVAMAVRNNGIEKEEEEEETRQTSLVQLIWNNWCLSTYCI